VTSLAELLRSAAAGTLLIGETVDLFCALHTDDLVADLRTLAAIREAFGPLIANESRLAALLKSIQGELVDAGCSVGDVDGFPALVREVVRQRDEARAERDRWRSEAPLQIDKIAADADRYRSLARRLAEAASAYETAWGQYGARHLSLTAADMRARFTRIMSAASEKGREALAAAREANLLEGPGGEESNRDKARRHFKCRPVTDEEREQDYLNRGGEEELPELPHPEPGPEFDAEYEGETERPPLEIELRPSGGPMYAINCEVCGSKMWTSAPFDDRRCSACLGSTGSPGGEEE
jgi:hypothetical protein